ncbi:MAG: VOC family protein [Candidatus Limnocylindrales bacterium]
MARARAYWEGTLGFRPTTILPTAVVYQCLDSWFVISRSGSAGTNQATALAFMSDDLEAEVAELKRRGVVFEEYDYPTLKTVDSIAQLAGLRAAWFKDTEGNIIGVVQFEQPPV